MDVLPENRNRWLAAHVLPNEPAMRARLQHLGKDAVLDVDDIVQETYAILATRASVAEITDPRAYAFQVARSVALQYLRRSKIVAIGHIGDLNDALARSDEPSPEQHAAGRAELRRVADAIDAMPPQARRVFTLRRVNGLSQREVAATLNISESTVEKHIARGIRTLMDRFGRGGKGDAQASRLSSSMLNRFSHSLDDRSRTRRND